MSRNSVVERLCTNQSWTMNWIQAAASRFRKVAGWNCSRVIRSRLTVRGLGTSRLAVSGRVCSIGTFRPKRQPADPMRGCWRSLLLPSVDLDSRIAGSRSGGTVRFSSGGSSVSCRFFSRSSFRISTSRNMESTRGNLYHSRFWNSPPILRWSASDTPDLAAGAGPAPAVASAMASSSRVRSATTSAAGRAGAAAGNGGGSNTVITCASIASRLGKRDSS